MVEEFVHAAKAKWPDCLIQFEDFPTDKAFDIHDRFRNKCLCFNGARALTMQNPLEPSIILVWGYFRGYDGAVSGR